MKIIRLILLFILLCVKDVFSQTNVQLTVGTNGELRAPLRFFDANSNKVNAVINGPGLSGLLKQTNNFSDLQSISAAQINLSVLSAQQTTNSFSAADAVVSSNLIAALQATNTILLAQIAAATNSGSGSSNYFQASKMDKTNATSIGTLSAQAVVATNFSGNAAGLTNLQTGSFNVKWLTGEPDGSSDNTPVLQAIINASDSVEFPRSVNPYITTGLVLHSNLRLNFAPGAAIKLKSGADNSVLFGSGVTNVVITGYGAEIMGNSANQFYPTNCNGIYVVHCTNVFVDGLKFRDMLGFSLRFGDFYHVGGSTLAFDSPKDGIHMNGQGGDGHFSGLEFHTGDDSTAVCASDWPGYDQTQGSISNIVFENIVVRGSVTVGRILAGTGTTVSKVTYRTVKGWTTSNPFGAYEDTVGPMNAGDIVYDDINVYSPAPQFIFSANLGDVTISNWRVQGVDNNLINTSSNIARLTINNASIDGVTNTTMLFGSATSSTTNVFLNNVSMRGGYTLVTLTDGAKKSMIVGNGLSVDGLSMGFQLQNDFTLLVDGVIAQNISGAFLRPFGAHTGYAQIGSRFWTNNMPVAINKDTPFTLSLVSASPNFKNTATLTQKRGDYVASNNGLFDSKNSMILGAGTERVSISSGNIGFNRDTDTGAMYDPTSFGWQLHHTFGGTSTSDFFTLQLYDTSGSSITPSPFTVRADGNIGFGTTNPLVRVQIDRVGSVVIATRDLSQVSGSRVWLTRNTGSLYDIVPGDDQDAAQSPAFALDRLGNSTNAGHVVAAAFIGSGSGLTNISAANVTSGFGAVANGFTGGTTPSSAFNNLNPTTTMGDTIYGTGGGTAVRLAPNVTTTQKFLMENGDGSTANAPAWTQIQGTNINFGTNLNLTVSNLIALAGITTPSIVFTAAAGDISDTSGYSASALVGGVPLANGGTAGTNAASARNNIFPSQSGHAGQFATTDGTNITWAATPGAGLTTYTATATVPAHTFAGLEDQAEAITVTGASVGDVVSLGAPTFNYNLTVIGSVDLTDTVFLNFHNSSTNGLTRPSATWKVLVTHF